MNGRTDSWDFPVGRLDGGSCEVCGARTAHRSYRYCARCWVRSKAQARVLVERIDALERDRLAIATLLQRVDALERDRAELLQRVSDVEARTS